MVPSPMKPSCMCWVLPLHFAIFARSSSRDLGSTTSATLQSSIAKSERCLAPTGVGQGLREPRPGGQLAGFHFRIPRHDAGTGLPGVGFNGRPLGLQAKPGPSLAVH